MKTFPQRGSLLLFPTKAQVRKYIAHKTAKELRDFILRVYDIEKAQMKARYHVATWTPRK